ncbi:type VI secretion system tube protein TssD [Flavobacterium sp. DG2-3]|uniref:type VI secretion system tube protein TssD n=1 Tax=Flavobacterium sp. DG2-3 TaxID=3068317 RepID=UPI00273ECE85|nr:type VI secretion system tube protein TssD [Flavobacterium sp. DG2-3]MDP5199145.1 type VI secretion system tube protein TssD [Flavobacterium sp. DG2-3]
MAALGILKLENKEFLILEFNYKCVQLLDALGKPSARPSGWIIDLMIESDSDTTLLEWTLSNAPKDGIITFYKHDGMSKFKEIKFEKSYCISHKEIFEADGNLPMRQIIQISEPRKENLKEAIMPPKKIVQEEPQKRITDIKWMCSEMKDVIHTASIGETVSILVKTINYKEGEVIRITVDEATGKDLQKDIKEIIFSGKVNADGIAELKEEVNIKL